MNGGSRPLSARAARREVRSLLLGALHDPVASVGLPPAAFDLTIRLLRRAQLLGRYASRLDAAGVLDRLQPVVRDLLESALVSAQARVRVARWELDRIAWAMEDTPQVPLVALKGCAYLLAATPNAEGRSFGDVDLLALESDLPIVESVLQAHGWNSATLSAYDDYYYRHWAHELPPMSHRERGVEVDLHHNIVMRTARLKVASDMLMADSRAVPGSRFRVLAPVDICLHAMTHLMYSGEMEDGLRELVDVADLLAHYGQHEPGFWQAFWPRARQLDLTRPAWYAVRHAQRLLHVPVPAHAQAEAATYAPSMAVQALMDRLLTSVMFPPHPDLPGSDSPAAKLLLFMRQHWVRMPPLMLARHLATKVWFRMREPGPTRESQVR